MSEGGTARLRPYPVADLVSEPFFRALGQRQLLVQCCKYCGAFQLAESRCTSCDRNSLVWTAASGMASLHSFTWIHVAYHPAFAAHIPYNAAIVELAEGPRIFSNVIDCHRDQLCIGLALTVDFLNEGEHVIPVFRPVS